MVDRLAVPNEAPHGDSVIFSAVLLADREVAASAPAVLRGNLTVCLRVVQMSSGRHRGRARVGAPGGHDKWVLANRLEGRPEVLLPDVSARDDAGDAREGVLVGGP